MESYATIAHAQDSSATIEVVHLEAEDSFRVTRYDQGQQWPVALFFDCKAEALQAALALAGFDPANIASTRHQR